MDPPGQPQGKFLLWVADVAVSVPISLPPIFLLAGGKKKKKSKKVTVSLEEFLDSTSKPVFTNKSWADEVATNTFDGKWRHYDFTTNSLFPCGNPCS